MKLGKKVYLTCDAFFVNTIPIFITLSRKIDFTTTAHLKYRNIKTIFLEFLAVYKFYLRRGFRIKMVHADNEFGPMKPLIDNLKKGPTINLAAANEHVPEIERRIQLIKERIRSVRSSLPFNKVPSVMIIYLVLSVSKLLTYFITKGGISKTMSPRAIMCGECLDQEKQLCLQFGEYFQVYEEELPRNRNKPRTLGAVCLGPTQNEQGGFNFMSLTTGAAVTRYGWDPIPMPSSVIARVNRIGKDQP